MHSKSILLILYFLFMLPANFAEADEIHLQDGKIIRARSFWEEDDKLMFEKYGSVVGINIRLVKVIRSNQPEYTSDQDAKTWQDPMTAMGFVWIPGGCFYTQNPVGSSVKEVCLDGFWMGKYEVTNSQFRHFAPSHNNQSYYQDIYLGENDLPAVNVSAEEAQAFADWLTGSNNGNFNFRLPTETEWKYASRGNLTAPFFEGDDPEQACYYGNFKDSAWQDAHRTAMRSNEETCYDGFVATSPVGSFEPNKFGLYDTLGNVSEWCIDDKAAHGSSFLTPPAQPAADQGFTESFSSANYWTGFRLVMQRKLIDGFETIDPLNEYGGQTKKLVRYEKDSDYEKGVWQIIYFFNADGKLAKKEVKFNNDYASKKGISKKVFHPDKQEVFYTPLVAADIGYNKATMYNKFRIKNFLKTLNLINSQEHRTQ